MLGECQNKTGQNKGRNLHVRDSFLPFHPSSEVARVRRMQQQEVAPATPSSSLSRPGHSRNVERLLAG